MKKISVDWEALRLFAALADSGTVAEAARILGLTQAVVYRRLRALEDCLGGALFAPSEQGVELTVLGQSVLEVARDMQDGAARLQQAVQPDQPRISGTVRVAVTEALGTMYLAPRLPELLAQWPELRVELAMDHHAVSLAKRDADIGIRFARPEASDLIAKRIGVISYFVAGSVEWIARMTDQADAVPFIAYDDGVPEIPETRWTSRNVPSQHIRFRSNSLLAQWTAARAGVGVALLPDYLIGGDIQVATKLPALTREVWMAFHRDVRNVANVQVVMSWIERSFAAARAAS